MERRFEGKTAVITGAAGGIGREACKRFAREGANVVIVDLPGSALMEAEADVIEAGSSALVVPTDVTKSDQVQNYATLAKQRFGTIDAFFNNAGIEGFIGPTLEYPEEMFDRVMAVNVKGVFLGMKYVIPVMREGGRGGAIVNTASVAGLAGTPTLFAYGASKHAVIGMSKSGALEFGRDNIRVNAICPSPIETRMMRSLERGNNPDNPEAAHRAIAANIPMGRYGEPEEVAALVAFLCSDDAKFISGGTYTIDGGSRAR